MRRLVAALALLGSGGCSTSHPTAVAPPDLAPDLAPGNAVPLALGDTGLYSDWASRTVDPSNRSYTPAFPLWSDGAKKSRWIHIPAGAQIDVTNIDEWQFPIGTKAWKEFRYDIRRADGTMAIDQRIETRMLWKRAAGDWQLVTYVWSAAQDEASLATAINAPPIPFPGTASYEVPVLRCHACHDRRQDKVLGFEAALLAAPETDPAGLTWDKLRAEKLVTSRGVLPDATALGFLSQGQPGERAAVGYLHTNCGITCHHENSGEGTPFFMRLEAGTSGHLPTSIVDTSVFQTAINKTSYFTPGGSGQQSFRIRPTDIDHSMVYYRMHTRAGLAGGGEQMPPIATHVIDDAECQAVANWIQSMTAPPYPPPAPLAGEDLTQTLSMDLMMDDLPAPADMAASDQSAVATMDALAVDAGAD